MQHCGKCGDYNLDESIFCSYCGTRLNYNCPSCGFQNLPNQDFCGGCGQQVSTTVSPPAYKPVQPEAAAPPSSPIPPEKTEQSEKSLSVAVESPIRVEDIQPQPVEQPTGTSEPVTFAPYQTLEAYALLSVEVANWQQLVAERHEVSELETAHRQVLRSLEQKTLAAGGQIQVSKTRIAFITFKQQADLLTSLQTAIDLALDALKQDFSFPGFSLKLKMGLDIEKAAARDPLTSTLERSMSLPGSLTVSEQVYQQVKDLYRVEPVGPVPMGNRMLQFYRILSPGAQLPSPATVMEPRPEPPPKSIVRKPIEPQDAPASPSPQPTASEVPSAPPPLPTYTAPVFGSFKQEPKAPNLDYTGAIEALISDLSAFLVQGTSAKGKVVSLAAPDGLGKSSIIQMVRNKIDPGNDKAIWLGGFNYRSLSDSSPLFYWIEVLQNMMSFMFEGHERELVQSQIEKFLAFIYDGQVPQEEAAFLFDFMSVTPLQPLGEDARHLSGRLELFFLKFLRHLSQKKPLILVFEELPNADAASVELLVNLLVKGLWDLPICILMTQTPEFYASGALADVLKKGVYRELVVAPLNDADAQRFLDDGPLGGRLSEFSEVLIDSVLRYAHGLPLYLEEALRLLHLRGVLAVDETTNKFIPGQSVNAEDAFLPDSLEHIIRERMNYLGDNTRYILQVASVMGERFSVNLLMAISQADEESFRQALTTLFNHGFLIPDAVNTGRFRHTVLWKTVYDMLEPDWRTQMHQLISETLEQDFQQGLTVHPVLIAHHAEQGGLLVRAVHFWNLGGIFAGRLGAWTAMNMAMTHALDLMKQQEGPIYTQELALRLAETLGSLNIQSRPEFAVGWLEWALYYRRVTGGQTAQLIETLGALTAAYEATGDFPKTLSTLESSLELINAHEYPLEAASLRISKMETLVAMGRYQQARDLMETDIAPMMTAEVTEQAEFLEAYLQARLLYGQILSAQCDPNTLTYLEEVGQMANAHDLTGLSVAVRLAQATYLLRSGQYELCNREADELLHTIENMGQPEWFLAQWGLLAMMYHCEMEDWESASQLTLTVIAKAEESLDYPTLATSQAYAGYIAGKLGKIKEARQTLESALQLASDHRMAAAALIGWRLLAEFELSLGNQEVAYELATKALEIARKPEIRNEYEILQLSLICARALLAYGEIKTAGKVLERLWLHSVQSKMRPMIAACAAEIGQLYKQMAHDAPADLSKKHLMRSTEFFLKAKGIWLELRHLANVKRVDAAIPRI